MQRLNQMADFLTIDSPKTNWQIDSNRGSKCSSSYVQQQQSQQRTGMYTYMTAEDDISRMLARVDIHTCHTVFSKMLLEL